MCECQENSKLINAVYNTALERARKCQFQFILKVIPGMFYNGKENYNGNIESMSFDGLEIMCLFRFPYDRLGRIQRSMKISGSAIIDPAERKSAINNLIDEFERDVIDFLQPSIDKFNDRYKTIQTV